jgi:hypothetical protein
MTDVTHHPQCLVPALILLGHDAGGWPRAAWFAAHEVAVRGSSISSHQLHIRKNHLKLINEVVSSSGLPPPSRPPLPAPIRS